jgi:hypothetical protein
MFPARGKRVRVPGNSPGSQPEKKRQLEESTHISEKVNIFLSLYTISIPFPDTWTYHHTSLSFFYNQSKEESLNTFRDSSHIVIT